MPEGALILYKFCQLSQIFRLYLTYHSVILIDGANSYALHAF